MIAILRKIDLPKKVVSAINAMTKEKFKNEKKTDNNDKRDLTPARRANIATACLRLQEIVKKYK